MQAARQQMPRERFYRSRDARMGGVCAGLAERYDFDPIAMRILVVLLTLTTFGFAAIVYAILWAALPREPEPSVPYDITPERAESIARGSLDCDPAARRSASAGTGEAGVLSIVPRLAIAAGLMLLFLAVATNAAPMVPGTQWWQFWPLAVLIVGLCLIVIPIRTRYEAAWHAAGVVITSFGAALLPMALGAVAWGTLPHALLHLWPLVVAAVALFGVGLYRGADAVVFASAFFIAAFCLLALLLYAVPGDVDMLYVHMPYARPMRIAFFRL